MKIVLCAIIAAFLFSNSSIASRMFLNCIITDEVTDTRFFEVNSTFNLETDGTSLLTIHLPPDGSITLNQYFDAYMGHIYAHEFNNLTSKSAFLQKDIFSPKIDALICFVRWSMDIDPKFVLFLNKKILWYEDRVSNLVCIQLIPTLECQINEGGHLIFFLKNF